MDLPLDKAEVLRYLGYRRKQTLTAELATLVDEVMLEIQQVAKPRYHFQIFDFEIIPEYDATTDDAGNRIARPAVHVLGTSLYLSGTDAVDHLIGADKIVLMVATLGIEVERQTRLYEVTDMTRALMLDASAVEYIEKIMDLQEFDVLANVGPGLTLNRRFSPGYGNVPLDVQPEFLATLGTNQKLGINLTETMLMVPRKSVTAFSGLFSSEPKKIRPKRRPPVGISADLLATHKWRIN